MMILNRNGTLEWNRSDGDTASSTSGSIDLPADLLMQQSDLIDRVFAFAFDVLGLVRIELRIRATEGTAEIQPALPTLACRDQLT
jgi:hypothetical protein